MQCFVLKLLQLSLNLCYTFVSFSILARLITTLHCLAILICYSRCRVFVQCAIESGQYCRTLIKFIESIPLTNCQTGGGWWAGYCIQNLEPRSTHFRNHLRVELHPSKQINAGDLVGNFLPTCVAVMTRNNLVTQCGSAVSFCSPTIHYCTSRYRNFR